MSVMMNNMFSMFDPSSSFLSSNWLVVGSLFLIFKKKSLKIKTKISTKITMMMTYVEKEINQLMEKSLKTSTMMFSMVFLAMLAMNFLAVFPYNFTPSAHMSMSFPITLSMWMSTMIFGWKNKFKSMMIHLTPMGTPNPLMNFMVLIEMVSSMIRPITLSIRLSANMVAGHLLMSLLSTFSANSYTSTIFSAIPMMSLTTLEIGVALVQAYVLMTLLILYQNET